MADVHSSGPHEPPAGHHRSRRNQTMAQDNPNKPESPGRSDEAQDPNREGGLGAPPKANQDLPDAPEVDNELPDTEASPDTDVSTTDAALEEGPPSSSGAIDEDAGDAGGS